jgi:hypothetical protein
MAHWTKVFAERLGARVTAETLEAEWERCVTFAAESFRLRP